jgi:signal transduction histidine kinase
VRPRRAFPLLEAVIVAAALATVGLLLLSIRLTASTLDRDASRTEQLARAQLELALGSKARAAATCRALVADGAPRAATTGFCTAIGRAPLDAALRAGDRAQRAVALETAARRRTLNRIDAGLVLLVLLVFAAVAALVSRRAGQLAAHNERLQRLDRLKDTFIAAVSHELRTPLTSTIGALKTVEARPLPAEQRDELLRIARVQAERLARLVDELLFFSEVETGRLRLSETTLDLSALAATAVEAAQPAAGAREVAVSAAGDALELRGDAGRLAQLLDHLVANAVKFTPAGGSVEVRTTVAGGRAVVEVADTGVGIAAAEQDGLFDRFFRSEAAVAQAVPGTGIGLAIVKAIVDAHSGTISVRSAEGAGTTVRVELPLPRRQEGSWKETPSPRSETVRSAG